MNAQVFQQFKPFHRTVPAGYIRDFIGTVTPPRFGARQVSDELSPVIDEEYFEWIDLLEAVENAGSTFVMAELGAGYGRWSSRGAVAARAKGKKACLILAEAEPEHAEWIREHMANNGIAEEEYTLFQAAVGASRGTMPFCIEMPADRGSSAPKDWYGQALVDPGTVGHLRETGRTYMGRPVKVVDGWGSIDIEVIPLPNMLAGVEQVDFIDIDIQGAEADVVAASIKTLNAKVKRLHIGTHSTEIEARLRAVLSSAGWVCVHDYPCQTTGVQTPFGHIDFADGVQGWRNSLQCR